MKSTAGLPCSSLGHLPADKWEFDEAVTACFDDMLFRSIPSYETMRRVCFDTGRQFLKHGLSVVDLGCSRGGALAEFVDTWGDQHRYVGVEISPPMREAAERRFEGQEYVRILPVDLRYAYPELSVPACLTLAVLTLQFTPIEYRHKILENAFRSTVPGGAIIVVEKILGDNARCDELLKNLYLTLKSDHGYSAEEIQRKKMSLEGVLVPVTAKWNEDLLRAAGFVDVECIWRHYNFAAWVAVKP